MDRERKIRTCLRTAVTRINNRVTTLLAAEEPDKDLVKVDWGMIQEKFKELGESNGRIMEAMLDNQASEADIDKEIETADEYQRQFGSIKAKIEKLLRPQDDDLHSVGSSAGSDNKRKFKLPKIELPKFTGDIKEWLHFWSLFNKIHTDEEIVNEDKFHYLVQSTVENSKARKLVESFPRTAENYEKAIKSLKARFGKDKMLIEVYIRELLQLVLQSALNHKTNIPLFQLFDNLESHLRALETLGVTSDKYTTILYPLVESCLPETVLRVWQRSESYRNLKGDDSQLSELMKFLKQEVEGEERISLAAKGFSVSKEAKPTAKEKIVSDHTPTATGLLATTERKRATCIFCQEAGHANADCYVGKRKNIKEKRRIITANKLCNYCLCSGHLSYTCTTWLQCFVCGERGHPSVMCASLPSNKGDTPKPLKQEENSTTNSVLSSGSAGTEVYLQTLVVLIKGRSKTKHIRVLMDTGSQRSYILSSLAREMGLESSKQENIIHQLFGGQQSQPVSHKYYNVTLSSLVGNFECEIEALDQSIICNVLPRIDKDTCLEELKKHFVYLSDEDKFNVEIELLLGADIIGRLLTGKQKLMESGLVAIDTKLGWTVMGKVPADRPRESTVAMSLTSLALSSVNIQDLWNLDLIGISDPTDSKSSKEITAATEEHFRETVTVNNLKRYEIHLPWIEGHSVLPENFNMAKKRLDSTTLKLQRDGKLNEYNKVFREWLSEGIIERVPEEEIAGPAHYLPHRHVVKENSVTTKIRPVFDASAKSKGHPSLNDCLNKGPNLIEQIPAILLGFRKNKLGVSADIRKAFLQISVRKKDCDYLRFLWWNETQDHFIVYRHVRVVFGVSCSPFLLGAVINFHLSKAPLEFNETALKLRRSFYVDNCVSSVSNQQELEQFITQSKTLMNTGGFDLRGWEHTNDGTTDPISSILGCSWNRQTDMLQCNMENILTEDIKLVTKRVILSIAHRVFDPIGFLCPVTLVPKLLLQQSWEKKYSWDQEVEEAIGVQFKKWVNELPQLPQIQVPRWLRSNENSLLSLHTFCDESSRAYAAVVYLREETELNINCQLVMAKARVAPVKKVTIPRLELLAALTGSRLAQFVKKELQLAQNIKAYMWTDSSTVLSWVKKDDVWANFVHNRVTEIKSLTQSDEWRHVDGDQNPADLPSRGCTVKQLILSKWWQGPAWLKRPQSEWKSTKMVVDETAVNQEKRKMIVSLVSTVQYSKRISKFKTIVRIMGWQLRFLSNCRVPGHQRIRGELRASEIELAELAIVKLIQKESFPGKPTPAIQSLCAFTDETGILRIQTKIIRRDDQRNFRYPIVLPSKHPIVSLLIKAKHDDLSHAGLQVTLNTLRESYWILGGRRYIRSVLNTCKKCKRQEVKKLTTPPAPLPLNRVKEAAIFEIVGVDLAGPFTLKGGQKSWMVLFTCAVFRAVHLEIASSLSTESFLSSLRRFISRRGRPAIVYSDNGTNFVGTDNLFKSLDWPYITAAMAIHKIEWRFNPPTAAWWGGWWERLIGMVKKILRRVLGTASLNYEELGTVFCDAEAVINSRPLTYVTDDVEDLIPLTPAMFLQERLEIGVPDLDIIDECSINRRWKYRQRLREELRKRFRVEYLGQLVQKYHPKTHLKLSVGDVVLLEVDTLKRISWPLARILDLITGVDGQVRTARIKTGSGIYIRPVQKLYPLELQKEGDQRLLENITRGRKAEPVLKTRYGREIKQPQRFSF